MSKSNDCHSLLSTITLLVLGLLPTDIHGAAAAGQAGFLNSELFPFGVAAGDVRGPIGDDSASNPVTLAVPFTFIGMEYNRIYVNSNGVLSFERSFTTCCGSRVFPRSSPPLVAPFWHDFNPRIGGNIYYRQTNDPQQLQFFHTRLNSALNTTCRRLSDIFPTLLFIATWDQVPQFGGSAQVNNTLQVMLATDGVQTLAVFIYKDINWGEGAQIGFNAGDGYTSLTLPEALSNQTRSIDERSNVGEPGIFIYHIDIPPDQAHALTVENTEATSIHISWRPPTLATLHTLYYLINANNLNGTDDIKKANTTNTFFNVTGLLPGTTYELTVVVVYECGGSKNIAMSQPNNSARAITTTEFTVPALTCNTPVSSNGVITATWSYIHTGGLPLTDISISYASLLNRSNVNRIDNTVLISTVDATSITVPNLTAGAEYIFNITAENRIGSSSILCGSTFHKSGRPAMPVFGDLIPGPNAGEIAIALKTSASGIDRQFSEIFWFEITPIHEGIEGESFFHLSLNYQSDTFETVFINGLKEGKSYIFSAIATNKYGSSQAATSISTFASTSKERGNCSATNTSIIIGAAAGVGSIVLLFIILLLTVVLIQLFVVRRGKTEISSVESILMNRVSADKTRRDLETKTEAIYDEPGEILRQVQQVSIRDSDGMIGVEECPAYGVSMLRDN